MRENLRANNREREAHQVYASLALAFTGRDQHALAAELAHHAYEFSGSDQDRAAALIHEGLCLREAREFEKADEVLKLASECAEDTGLVAYHRGRVQFDWGEYIDALDRFEEALASGSRQLPLEDMCFEMALSHIHLEEYKEARTYLERSLKPGQKKSPVSFYLGICDLAEGEVQKAMDHFGEALQLDPAEEDLGRILFYVATCLKEMEHFEEAIDVLERAVAADPGDILNHNLLGFCYYKLKRHEAAVACFRRAVEINPGSAIDWASLGSNLRDLGRIDEAIEMYEKALSLDPTIGFARENLAKLTKRR
jgi:tetratricopeptide (TPR) repeat protein